jgi:hypothetical protein
MGAASLPRDRATREKLSDTHRPPELKMWKRYGFAWVTLAFFLFSLVGHWFFGWLEFITAKTPIISLLKLVSM